MNMFTINNVLVADEIGCTFCMRHSPSRVLAVCCGRACFTALYLKKASLCFMSSSSRRIYCT